MCSALNIMTEANGKYLGLPANVGLDKIASFQHLIDSIIMKTKWLERKIIIRWREKILLKSGVQAIPTYVVLVFKIPKKIWKEIIGL